MTEELHKLVDDLVKTGELKAAPGNEWAAPVFMVPKKNQKWSMVTDFCKMNELCQNDVYPLPLIWDLIRELRHAKYFACLDLNWGFWNVKLGAESQQYTGMMIPGRGVYVSTNSRER
eukprot:GHVP01038802.1.p1 GENE.GHVP01038802.1~~GHVP01038802.1.p1  ORF type:complete len:117 (+),score=15.47 GHVP01038802.1:990-1340(+)